MKLKKTFFEVGKFLRLIDENNQMSITNIAVLVVLYKVGMAQDVNLYDAGLILIALLNYSYKRFVNSSIVTPPKEELLVVDKVKNELQDLKDKVNSLQIAAGLTRNRRT